MIHLAVWNMKFREVICEIISYRAQKTVFITKSKWLILCREYRPVVWASLETELLRKWKTSNAETCGAAGHNFVFKGLMELLNDG
jgi:hypothetical protein